LTHYNFKYQSKMNLEAKETTSNGSDIISDGDAEKNSSAKNPESEQTLSP